jgi:hypothetical protein
MKYETKYCTVFDIFDNSEPNKRHFYDVKIALGSWDGQDDAEDESIFYYMDNEPLEVGVIVGEDFVVAHVDEVTE